MTLTTALSNQTRALLAHGFVAGSLADVFFLDVVACVAVRADVMVGLLDRVPGRLFHFVQILLRLGQQSAQPTRGEMSISCHSDVGFLSAPQRFWAAFRAISLRRLGERAAALAVPPLAPPSRPSATAAGFFLCFGGACPVASATTRKAASATSSFFLERLGMCLSYLT